MLETAASRAQVLGVLAEKRDLTGAVFSDARSRRVDRSTARVPPAELPGSLPEPLPWLPIVVGCALGVLLATVLRRKGRQRSWGEWLAARSARAGGRILPGGDHESDCLGEIRTTGGS